LAQASVIHYGVDPCARITVLRAFGFGVEECDSLPELEQLSQSLPVAAVLFPKPPSGELIDTVHRISTAPLVCFTLDPGFDGHERLDLVIKAMTNPEVWLQSIRQLLERSVAIQMESAATRSRSASLRAESVASRKQLRRTIDTVQHTYRDGKSGADEEPEKPLSQNPEPAIELKKRNREVKPRN
jgi:hypothetical protein